MNKTKLENEAQYRWAEKRVFELEPYITDDMPQDDPKYIEFEILGNLVSEYCEEYYPVGEPSLLDIIKLRMYEMGLTQDALAKLLKIAPSRISELLSGKREPTFKQARVISEKLNIDPAIVLGVKG